LQTRKQISESKEAQKEQANKTVLASQVGRIVEYLVQHPEGDTKTGIREELKINGSKITAGLDEAIEQGVVEKGKITKNNKTWPGYRPTAKCGAHPDNPDSQDGLDCPAGG
jgi:predicted HTH transcriptional regulator